MPRHSGKSLGGIDRTHHPIAISDVPVLSFIHKFTAHCLEASKQYALVLWIVIKHITCVEVQLNLVFSHQHLYYWILRVNQRAHIRTEGEKSVCLPNCMWEKKGKKIFWLWGNNLKCNYKALGGTPSWWQHPPAPTREKTSVCCNSEAPLKP